MNQLSQYLDLYLQTGREYIESLNKSLLMLEKNPADSGSIEEVFRSAHSLKSQSAAMGFSSTGYLCHIVEDVFYEIKQGLKELTPEIADQLFFAFDSLTNSLNRIEKEKTELDLSSQAETLKKLSGVNTEGDGKSQRENSSLASPKATATPVVTSIKASTEKTDVLPSEIKTINVKVELLDDLMDLLEELLVERLKLKKVMSETENNDVRYYYEASQKIIDGLQFKITQARAIPLKIVFEHFPRAIRDISHEENKQVELLMEGGDLELDRTIVDKLDEPLTHLLRNAVSHGIKDKGVITLSAKREKDAAFISVSDNGVGIDWDKLREKASPETKKVDPKELLFSGISTSDHVTQISGRGVGLKAVKKMVEDFGGSIGVLSEKGKGTKFTIKLPLTLAIAQALLIKAGQGNYAIPTVSIDRIIKVPFESVKKTADQEAFILDETEVPLMRLTQILKLNQPKTNINRDFLTVVVEANNEKVGLVVDEVIETVEIVIKPVPISLKKIKQFAGTTILSNGNTALILNPQEILI
jgi:two-component system, chemotaxis family, sensor kinase CheA